MMAGVRVTIANELQEAVECLQRGIARVEFWADALEGFSAPIPDYRPSDSRLSEFVLPHGARDTAPATRSEGPEKNRAK
jgi:hypothetical protein